VKNGPRRLFVPNSAFLTREFMVVDDPSTKTAKRDLGADGEPVQPLLGFPFSRRSATDMNARIPRPKYR
jgi:hypothetical protein